MKILPISTPRYICFASNKTKTGEKSSDKNNLNAAMLFINAARNTNKDNKAEIKSLNKKMLNCFGAQFDDENQLAIELLHLEDLKTIERFAELKKTFFGRKLTDDEALFLARPYSIRYADITESRDDIYIIEDKFQFEIDTAKKIKTRRFDDDDIKIFIDTKDRSNDFTSTNQIMRFVELMKPANGLTRKLNPEEARYFARKCANLNEIQSFLDEIDKNLELKTIYNKVSKKPYTITYRKNQTDNTRELKLHVGSKGQDITYTFKNGKLISLIKSSKAKDNSIQTYDAFKRTTSIINLGLKPLKHAQAEYPKEVIEILNDALGQPNKILRTYIDENDNLANTQVFVLSDYDETLDVLKLIEEGQLQPSFTTTNRNTIGNEVYSISQTFQTNDASLTRRHSIDDNWYRLSCKIKDSEDNILHKTYRTFRKIAENMTISVINGTGYFAEFDDENQSAIITREDGKQFYINEIIGSDILCDDLNFSQDYEQKRKELWDFCKNKVPADLLIIMNKYDIQLHPVEFGMDSEYSDSFNAIFCNPNVATLSHEIGHVISLKNRDSKNETLSKNPTLRKIYKEELEKFNEIHSSEVSKYILGYFNETGSNQNVLLERESYHARNPKNLEKVYENTGLEEIFAETMYIITYPDAHEPIIALRTHFLMMYFPKTIAYASKLIEECYKNAFIE